MANGDKDDKKKKKKKQQAGNKNERVLRPQGSGATKSLGEVVSDVGKFATETLPAVGAAVVESTQPAIPVKAPKVDFQFEDKKEEGETIAGIDAAGFTAPARRRTEDPDNEDLTPKPKFFGDIGQSETGSFLPETDKKEEARLKAFRPLRRGEFSPERQEEARFKAFGTTEGDITAFDSDGSGKLNTAERADMRAFKRQELLTGFRERKEKAEASLAATNARRAEAAAAADQRLLNEMGDELIAKDKAAAETAAAAAAAKSDEQIQNRRKLFDRVKTLSEQGRLTTETYEKLKAREGGLVNLSPEEFDKTFKAAGIIPNDQSGGLRRKDFASNEAFLAAVGRNQASQPQGAQAAPMGSGSALRQAPRELGSLSGRLRRAGRAARRDGATAEANKLFGAAAMQGLREPNILSEEQRGRIAAKQREAQSINESNRAFEKKLNEYASRVLDARIKGLETGGLRTGGLGIGKMGPVFRPDGAVTSTYGRGDGTRGTMTTRRRPDMGAGMNFVDFEGT